MPRPATIRITRCALLLATAASLGACETPGPDPHPLVDTRIWQQYRQLEENRALALAGDPTRIWVAGMAGGQTSPAVAASDALAECGRQRAKRRLVAPCRLYAKGSRIVWTEDD